MKYADILKKLIEVERTKYSNDVDLAEDQAQKVYEALKALLLRLSEQES